MLFINGREFWKRENEPEGNKVKFALKFYVTTPGNFRKRVKERISSCKKQFSKRQKLEQPKQL